MDDLERAQQAELHPSRKSKFAGPIVVAIAALALVLVGSASSQGRYTDETGDSGAAPDINGATVSSDATGHIVFRISDVSLNNDADVYTGLFIDTDMNAATGSPNTLGADYAFFVGEKENVYDFARWTGSEWGETPYTTVSVFSNPLGVTISVNRSELGNTNEFNFWVNSFDAATKQRDEAPDDGTWNYSLQAGGVNIQTLLLLTKPGLGPKAGRPFTVLPAGLRVPNSGAVAVLPQPESYTCTAKLAGKRLVGAGRGGCTWKLGKKARGKRLAVAVTVTYQGTTKTFSFPYSVT